MVDLKAFSKILRKGKYEKLKEVEKDNFSWQEKAIKNIVNWIKQKSIISFLKFKFNRTYRVRRI